jgi:hypothetical protein
LLCNGDVPEDVEENDILAFVTYYHMLHKRNLNVARKLPNMSRRGGEGGFRGSGDRIRCGNESAM